MKDAAQLLGPKALVLLSRPSGFSLPGSSPRFQLASPQATLLGPPHALVTQLLPQASASTLSPSDFQRHSSSCAPKALSLGGGQVGDEAGG